MTATASRSRATQRVRRNRITERDSIVVAVIAVAAAVGGAVRRGAPDGVATGRRRADGLLRRLRHLGGSVEPVVGAGRCRRLGHGRRLVAGVGDRRRRRVRDRRGDRRPAAQPAGRAGAVGRAHDQRPVALGAVVAVRRVRPRDGAVAAAHRRHRTVAPRAAAPAGPCGGSPSCSASSPASPSSARSSPSSRPTATCATASGPCGGPPRRSQQGDIPVAVEELERSDELLAAASDALDRPWARPALAVPVLGQHLAAWSTSATAPATSPSRRRRRWRRSTSTRCAWSTGVIDVDAIEVLERPFGDTNAALRRMSAVLASARSPWLVAPVGDRVDQLAARGRRARRADRPRRRPRCSWRRRCSGATGRAPTSSPSPRPPRRVGSAGSWARGRSCAPTTAASTSCAPVRPAS